MLFILRLHSGVESHMGTDIRWFVLTAKVSEELGNISGIANISKLKIFTIFGSI
jgi:hypothetical protein